MYAIGEFKYGINLKSVQDDETVPQAVRDEIADLDARELLQSSYNGGGDQPLYLGVDVTDIDECSDMNWEKIVELKNELKAASDPEGETHKEYLERLQEILDLADVSDETKVWFNAQVPEVFLTWASS